MNRSGFRFFVGEYERNGFSVLHYYLFMCSNPSLPWEKDSIKKLIKSSVGNPFEAVLKAAIASNTGVFWSRTLLRDLEDVFLPECKQELVQNPAVWQRAYAANITAGSLHHVLRTVVR